MAVKKGINIKKGHKTKTKVLKDFAVVLIWDTESDEGEAPVLVGVRAVSKSQALSVAVKQAKSGDLSLKLYSNFKEEDREPMKIDKDKSFACPTDRILFIN